MHWLRCNGSLDAGGRFSRGVHGDRDGSVVASGRSRGALQMVKHSCVCACASRSNKRSDWLHCLSKGIIVARSTHGRIAHRHCTSGSGSFYSCMQKMMCQESHAECHARCHALLAL
jgi:hypothetical protein